MWSDSVIVFGAIGLILLGMDWISNGLKTAAGPGLLHYLQRWTAKPVQGLTVGIVSTVAVQSSTVTTVAVISFVNAGILSLYHAAYVIYGSNIGTSVTGWFVALIGLQFKVELLAMPMVGLGALLKLFSRSVRQQGLGEGLIGFGVFFLGIGFMKDSFDAAFVGLEFSYLDALGFAGLLLAVLLGTVLSVVMQASVAVIAMAITVVNSGLISLEVASAIVIGASIGTTSTAIMSTLAATAQAKRLAWLHVIFNLLTGLIALLLLSPLLWILTTVQLWFMDSVQAAVTLALYHTLFKIVGVMLIWPFTGRLVSWLNKRFQRKSMLQLDSLDDSSLLLPEVALKTLSMENLRVAKLIAGQALLLSQGRDINSGIDQIRQLQRTLSDYVVKLVKQPLSDQEAAILNKLVQSQLRLDMVVQLMPHLVQHQRREPGALEPEQVLWKCLETVSLPEDAAEVRQIYRELSKWREQHKKALYKQVLSEHLSNDQVGDKLIHHAELRRFNQQLTKAMLVFGRLKNRLDKPAAPVSEENNNAS
ncbi:Na/Pi symporter [Chromatiaceae bacterium AAb-1]|nr:Na/Pi symporter [Chromatiaceae bacterium AAb-1]